MTESAEVVLEDGLSASGSFREMPSLALPMRARTIKAADSTESLLRFETLEGTGVLYYMNCPGNAKI